MYETLPQPWRSWVCRQAEKWEMHPDTYIAFLIREEKMRLDAKPYECWIRDPVAA